MPFRKPQSLIISCSYHTKKFLNRSICYNRWNYIQYSPLFYLSYGTALKHSHDFPKKNYQKQVHYKINSINSKSVPSKYSQTKAGMILLVWLLRHISFSWEKSVLMPISIDYQWALILISEDLCASNRIVTHRNLFISCSGSIFKRLPGKLSWIMCI